MKRRAQSATLGLAFLALLAACVPGSHPEPLHTIPNTDVNAYGVNVFLDWEVEEWKMRKELQMIRDASIGWVMQEFPWNEIEPDRKGQFWDSRWKKSSWDKWDLRVNLAREFGLNVVARLDRPPTWSRSDNSLPTAPPDDFNDYGDFVYEFVKHFKGRIRYFQLWNEPNIWPEWGNRPPDPGGYTALLKTGYERAKQADPNCYVLTAALAITLEDSPRAMVELDFLEKMYQAGTAAYFDILAANAYGMDEPPTAPASRDRLNFQRVTLLRKVMEANGDANKPVWLDELGWNASPRDMPPQKLIWRRVSEQQQADYTVQAIDIARSWPWVGVVAIWYFRQDGSRSQPSDSEYYFRMVNPEFTTTPLYGAVKRSSLAVNPVVGPGAYQETARAVTARGNWENRIARQASAEAYLVSAEPGATVTIKFRGSRLSLLARRDDAAGIAFVSIDGSSNKANKLPQNQVGKAAVDLYSPRTVWQALIPIATGLGGGDHVAQVTVSGEKNPASRDVLVNIDGFEVD